MIETKVKLTIAHELSVKDMNIDEINLKIRKFLEDYGSSDCKFWELGKDFCYEDSYPVEMTITTSFNV